MAPHVQLLALCLLPLLSVCRTDDGQGRPAVWRLSSPPLSGASRQVSRQPRQHTKDRSDGSTGGPERQAAAVPSRRRATASPDAAVQGAQSLLALSSRVKQSLPVPSTRMKRSLPVSLKPGSSGAARRVARLAVDGSSPSHSQPSPAASRRADYGSFPANINALLRSNLGRGGPRRPPPGSFVARLPPRGVRGRPYLVRLPGGHQVSPTRKRKRVVLIVPVKSGSALRRPAVVPVVRGAGGYDRPALEPLVKSVVDYRPPVVPVTRDAEGRYRPPGNHPPLQRHTVLNPQKVYTLDNPQLRKSVIKGYGPPKLKDVISCRELDVSDCYV